LKVWLNGELVDEADAAISPHDRGLLLGDGVFETLRTYGGRLLPLHRALEDSKYPPASWGRSRSLCSWCGRPTC